MARIGVPTYEYDAGLKSFADIAEFGDKLQHKICGIEPRNDGNALLKNMIDSNQFDLKDSKWSSRVRPAC